MNGCWSDKRVIRIEAELGLVLEGDEGSNGVVRPAGGSFEEDPVGRRADGDDDLLEGVVDGLGGEASGFGGEVWLDGDDFEAAVFCVGREFPAAGCGDGATFGRYIRNGFEHAVDGGLRSEFDGSFERDCGVEGENPRLLDDSNVLTVLGLDPLSGHVELECREEPAINASNRPVRSWIQKICEMPLPLGFQMLRTRRAAPAFAAEANGGEFASGFGAAEGGEVAGCHGQVHLRKKKSRNPW